MNKTYKTYIDINQFAIRDHVVQGINILPGVTFFDIVLDVLHQEGLSEESIRFTSVSFKKTLSITPDKTAEVQIILDKKNADSGDISILSRLDRNDSFDENFTCSFSSCPVSGYSADLASLKAGVQKRDIDSLYQLARNVGIVHSGNMKPNGSIYETPQYVLTELSMAESGYLFYANPVFLDSATLAPSILRMQLYGLESDDLLSVKPGIPFFIQEMRFYRAFTDRVYVYVRKSDLDDNRSEDIQYANIMILNEDGKAAAEFEKLTLKTIRSKELISVGSKHNVHKNTTAEKSENQDIRSFLVSYITSVTGKSAAEIDSKMNFYNIGLDSTDLVDFVKQIEDAYDVKLYPTLLFEYTNIDALTEYLTSEGLIKEQTAKVQAGQESVRLFAAEKQNVPLPEETFAPDCVVYLNADEALKQVIPEKTPQPFICCDDESMAEAMDKASAYGRNIAVIDMHDSQRCAKKLDIFSHIKLIASKTTELNISYVYALTGCGGETLDSVSALLRTLTRECQSVSAKQVSFGEQYTNEKLLETALLESRCVSVRFEEISWQDTRLRAEMTELVRQEKESAIVRDGCYLITGGSGKIAGIIARKLRENYGCRIILNGRTSSELVGDGISYEKADVTQFYNFKKLIDRLYAEGTKIDGIIHCAGCLNDSLIINKDVQLLKNMTAPKIAGTDNILKIAKQKGISQVILFSSMSSVFGNVGQSDYAFGNGYMNYCARTNSEDGMNCVSICWPLWKNGGMAANTDDRAISDEDAFAVLEYALKSGNRCFTAVSASLDEVRSLYCQKVQFANNSSAETFQISESDIAVIGMSGVFPLADSVDEYWENLRSGRNCITEIPADRHELKSFCDALDYPCTGGFVSDIDKFDYKFFGIAPRDAKVTDPQEHMFMETAFHAFEDAGYTRNMLSRKSVGVYVGAMYNYYQAMKMPESPAGDTGVLSSMFSSIANKVSWFFDLNGPSLTLDTMCSSAMTGIHLACAALRAGEIEMALVGGVNLNFHPHKYLFLQQNGLLSMSGTCNSFGEKADGYVPGEGSAAVLLKPLSAAVRDGDRICGVIKASAMNHNGNSTGYAVPNPLAQRDVMEKAAKSAGISPDDIDYIETQAVGSELGDSIEVRSIGLAYNGDDLSHPCPIGSVKSCIGHLEPASGLASMIKVLLEMKYSTLVPTLTTGKKNQQIDFSKTRFYVQEKTEPWVRKGNKPKTAAVNTFAAGGANVHVILQEYKQIVPESAGIPKIFAISAASENGLKRLAERYISFLRSTDLPLSRITYTQIFRREAFAHRLAIPYGSADDLINALEQYIDTGALPDINGSDAELCRRWMDNKDTDLAAEVTSGGMIPAELPEYPFEKTYCWFRKYDGIEQEEADIPMNETADAPASAEETMSVPETESKVSEPDVEERMNLIWQKAFGYDEEIELDESFYDLGGNSLIVKDILNEIESSFGVSLSFSDFYQRPTIGQLSEMVVQLMKN